jgi:hypothetical protein
MIYIKQFFDLKAPLPTIFPSLDDELKTAIRTILLALYRQFPGSGIQHVREKMFGLVSQASEVK